MPKRSSARAPCLWMTGLIWCCLAWCLFTQAAEAFDRRFALLVANEQGWKGDPRLRYVINGDVRPMARRLRQIGFEVQILENRNVHAVRRAFRALQKRLKKENPITTFLFYYSGHADRNAFHFGARKASPMTFQEFARFLYRLQVMRRIAIIDSCYSGEIIRRYGSLQMYKRSQKLGQTKGAKRHRALNIKKLLLPSQGRERGIRIISSSLHLAWELHQYKASIFTYHLLRGLNHAADLNRDGKITVDELFDYASREVTLATGQRPQQLVQVQREEPYSLAPAYRSRLWIGPQVVGHLRIRVGNFMWSRHKRRKQPLRLAVIEGSGWATLQRHQQCWRQGLLLRKHGEVRLGKRWESIPCQDLRKRRKGVVFIPARVYDPAVDPAYPMLVSPRRLHRYVALSGGYVQAPWPGRSAPAFLAQLKLRWDPITYLLRPDDPLFWSPRLVTRVGVDVLFPFRPGGLGAVFGTNPQQQALSLLLQARVQGDVGWSVPLFSPVGIWTIYPHAQLHSGISLISYDSLSNVNAHFLLGGGVGLEVNWWLSQFIGLQAIVQASLQYHYQDSSGISPFSMMIQASLACLVSL